ncbi:MAG: hypothetical protein LBU16_10795 [Treponema sp.]|jgi:hypothetical protein|nr:hypothetical protein [Treponema sp.]
MGNKTLAITIIAALGIPLFPLSARFYLSQNSAAGFQEATQAPQDVPETPTAAPEVSAEPGMSSAEASPPISPETLARVFVPPNKAATREETPADSGTGARAQPVPGDGKFSYLGLIRDSNDQEWLYIKEEETGKVISVNARAASINEEYCVVEIEGTSYFIRRK